MQTGRERRCPKSAMIGPESADFDKQSTTIGPESTKDGRGSTTFGLISTECGPISNSVVPPEAAERELAWNAHQAKQHRVSLHLPVAMQGPLILSRRARLGLQRVGRLQLQSRFQGCPRRGGGLLQARLSRCRGRSGRTVGLRSGVGVVRNLGSVSLKPFWASHKRPSPWDPRLRT